MEFGLKGNSLPDPQDFESKYRPHMEAALLSRCFDERSRQAARDIVSDVISDCFGGGDKAGEGRCLLSSYSGRSPLKQWLTMVAISRLKNWWRSGRNRFEQQVEDPSHAPEFPTEPGILEEPEVTLLLTEALTAAFSTVQPHRIVFVRLIYLHGVTRERVAEMWGCHPSSIGREVSSALETVRVRTLEVMRNLDPFLEISWGDCLGVCGQFSELLHGKIPLGRENNLQAGKL